MVLKILIIKKFDIFRESSKDIELYGKNYFVVLCAISSPDPYLLGFGEPGRPQ